jgi:hypothetical protein
MQKVSVSCIFSFGCANFLMMETDFTESGFVMSTGKISEKKSKILFINFRASVPPINTQSEMCVYLII